MFAIIPVYYDYTIYNKGEITMKKFLSVFFVIFFALSVVACENAGSEGSTADSVAEENAKLSAGDVFQLENLKITVDEIIKTTEPIVSDDEFEITPDEGKALVIIKYEVENTGSEADMLNGLMWDAYADGYQVGTEIQLFDIDGYSSFGSEIAAGKKAREYVCCQVPEDCVELEITYDNFGDSFVWNLEFSE